MRKPSSYHKFTAKPVDNAYIDRGEREGNMKRQRTYWKKRMIEAILESRGKRPKKPVDWRKAGEMIGGALAGAMYGGALSKGFAHEAGERVRRKHSKENTLVNRELARRDSGEGQESLISLDPKRNKRVNLLDPKAIITGETLKRSSLPKGVTWAQSPSTIQKWGKQAGTPSAQRERLQSLASQGDTAFARAPNIAGKRPLVIANKRLPRETIQHEFGHAQVINQEKKTADSTAKMNMTPAPFFKNVKTHPVYQDEKKAWDISGVPQGHIQPRLALKTYETSLKARQAQKRTSVGIQAASATLGAMSGAKIAGDRVDQRRARNLQAARGRINLVHPKTQIAREDIMRGTLKALIIENIVGGRPMSPASDNTAKRRQQVTSLGNDSPRRHLSPNDRMPTIRMPKSSNSIREDFIDFVLMEGEFSHAARQYLASRGMRGRGGESFRRQAKQRMVSRAKEVGKDAATIAAYGAGSGFTGALVGASQGAGLATQGMSDMASRTAGRTIEKLPSEVSSQPRVPKGVGHIKTREALNAWAKNPKNFDAGPFGVKRAVVNLIGNDMVPAKGQEKDFTGKNAMFLPAATKEGVPVVVAPRNAASHIMRHEVGHAKDFTGQTAKEVNKIYGASPKDTFKAEVRAWRNAGVHPADPVRKVTLGSYKEGLRRQAASSKGAKVGALAGGVIGTAQGVFQGASAVAKNKRAEASASARSQAVHNRFQRRSDDARFDLAVKRRYKEAEDRKKITEAIIRQLYEYGVTVDNRGDTVAKGVPTDSQGRMLPVAPGAKPFDTGSPNAPPTVKSEFQKQQAARQSANQTPSSTQTRQGGSALNIQRGTPGTAARPGGGGYSGGIRRGGGSGNPAAMQTGRHNPAAMQTGRHNPLNSAGGRSISPNRGVVSPATSSMRTGMRSSSGAGGSRSMAGSVRFSSGSASGGASAFSNRRY